ncbi:hypothetical protein Leryth_002051 [Lithospermum erythrorhizon]|nr:hypothetical protein Leryth_002051 [Lithospermum erythrorhizon]
MHMEFNKDLFLYFLCISSSCVILFKLMQKINKRNRLPPGPKGYPIIGNLLSIGDRAHESLAKYSKKYGPLMTVQLGYVTTIIVASSEMARQILQKNDQVFAGRYIPDAATAQTDYHLAIPWLSTGPHWRKLRRICTTEIFTMRKLDELQEKRHKVMNDMIKVVGEARENNKEISLGAIIFGTVLNMLSNTMYSGDMLDLRSHVKEEMKEAIDRIFLLVAKPNYSDYFPFLKMFDLQGIRKDIKVSYDRLQEMLEVIIELRKKERELGSSRVDDFLDVLLDHCQSHGNDELTHKDVRFMLQELFIAGSDTSSTTSEWVMAELLHHPNIMAKVKKELEENIKGENVREGDIPKLRYLRAVIKETIRLHATSPLLLPHRSEADIDVCGFFIPKHTRILINVYQISRDPAYWDEPLKFKPERFMNSEIDFQGRHYCFIPFGAGRRICPGWNLGIRMMTLMLATLVHNFDWKLPNGMTPEEMDMKDKFGITLQKAEPLFAIPM